MFRDNYTDFWFDDKNSVAFNVWMTNQHDIQNNLSPTFTDKFATPTYAQQRYYEGTTLNQQDLKVKCAAIGITRDDWRAIAEWFSPLKTGKLVFCWNPSHYYMVKVSKQPTNAIWALNRVDSVRGEIYIVTFELQFTTVGDWAALGQPAIINESTHITDPEALERYKNEFYIPMMLTRAGIAKGGAISSSNNYFILYDNVACTWTEEYWSGATTDYIVGGSRNPLATITQGGGGILIKYYDDENLVERISFGEKKYFYNINCNAYYVSSNHVNVKFEGSIGPGEMLLETSLDQALLLSNPATYDMFPKIYALASSFKLLNDREILYQVSTLENPQSFEIDCRNSLITSIGQIINSLQIFGQRLFNTDVISKPYQVSSGRPELLKGTVQAVSETILGVLQSNYIKLTLRINKALKYSRENNYIVHLFSSVPQSISARFDVDNYGWTDNDKIFIDSNWTSDHYICFNPKIAKSEIEGCIDISFTNNIKYDPTNSYGTPPSVGQFTVGNTMYLAICDTEVLPYELDRNGSFDVVLQCRDMM